MELKNLYKSKKVRYAVGSIVILGFFLLFFQAGVFLGYHRAIFSTNLGNNYLRTFEDDATSTVDSTNFLRRDFPGGHGAIGKVVKVNLPTLIIATPTNVEEIVRINDDTIIRRFMNSASSTDLISGEAIMVIGSPNASGEIEARLIRIMQ